MDELVFTPAAILDLLTKIDELKEYNIGIAETLNGGIQIRIDESIYEIDPSTATPVTVDPSVVEDVEDTNEEAYSALASSGEVSLSTDTSSSTIQSGVLKELVKSLLVGGMVRLTAKLIK